MGCFKISDSKDLVDLNLCLFEGYITLEDNMQVSICPSETRYFFDS